MLLKINALGISKEITEGTIVSIGRAGHGATIEIDDSGISRAHAEVKLENGQIKILDKKSKNHTIINGTAIQPEIWHTVNINDRVSVHNIAISFLQNRPNQAPEPEKFSTSEPNPPKPKPEPGSSGKGKGHGINEEFRKFINHKLPVTIGRSTENNIVLPDLAPDDRIVGRTHAVITYKDDRYWIEDLDSKNGTYVNDIKIPARQPRPIEPTDIILIHLHYFNLNDGYRDLRQELAIKARGLEKKYGDFVGLHPLDIEIPRNQIVALMGPSGCGKSTLLKALNGDNPATAGDVFIHGLSLRKNYNLLKKKIGYVPQDDIIHKELTVNRTLYLAAKLRLPEDTTDEEIQDRINKILAGLNFADRLREKKIHELSGGQRKKTCIAVELLSQPTILFLDEPTSPLDPESIKEFLEALQELAKNGTTIVMVTHKPEDLYYADQVIFLAAGGYIVHHGDKEGLLYNFKADNIIKIYNICGGQEFDPEKFYIKPSQHSMYEGPHRDIALDKQSNLLIQFYWLSRRYLEMKLNDKSNLRLLVAQPVIIAGLVSIIFHKVGVQVMMLIAVSAIWFGVSNSSKEIVSEFAVYKRERMFNLSIHTYILSKWVVLSLIALVQVLIYMSIVQLAFNGGGILGDFIPNMLFMFLIASASSLFGLFLSSYFNTTEKVLTVVPIALMPQIMLAGVVERLTSINIDFLSYFTFGRWGTEGLTRLQNFPQPDNSVSVCDRPPTPLSETFYNCDLEKSGPNWIIHLFDGLDYNIFIIVLLSILLYTLTYFSLKRKDTI